MAVPKRRHSKSRRDKKRTHKGLKAIKLAKCNHCSRLMKSHKVCPHCGYYKGKKIVQIKEKEKKRPAS
jgi:large subunit ribosomal protein L32